ncbi:MAG TPA: Maf family protein [Cyclobacteriaceae bacterium]|nr:Maf family protein [Cyclobacteriaceae bacterium]
MNFKRHLILASSSPRRQFLMREAGFTFDVRKPDVEEDFPATMPAEEVPLFLAGKKADYFKVSDEEVVVTADTIVVINGSILNKPGDRDEAIKMLTMLSGKTHHVFTGVCISSLNKRKLFREETGVTFKKINRQEIEYYVDNFKPFDKAGSYGAQECLPEGMEPCSPDEIAFLKKIGKPELVSSTIESKAVAAIKEISGSYFNVMGLPVHRVYWELNDNTKYSDE